MLKGLEISITLKSQLEYSARIDSEHYRKEFLRYQEQVNAHDHAALASLANFLIGPFGSAYDTENYVDVPDYRYVRGQDVKPFVLKDDDNKFIDKKDFIRLSKYALQVNDILVSVVGTLGNACIVQDKDVPAIFSCKSTVIRTRNINSYFLISYLNSKQVKRI